MRFVIFSCFLLLVAVALTAPTLGPSDEPAGPDAEFIGSDHSTRCRLCTIDCAQFPYFYPGLTYERTRQTGFGLSFTALIPPTSKLQCAKRYYNYGCHKQYPCFSSSGLFYGHVKTAALFCRVYNKCKVQASWTTPTIHDWAYQTSNKRMYAFSAPDSRQVGAYFKSRLVRVRVTAFLLFFLTF